MTKKATMRQRHSNIYYTKIHTFSLCVCVMCTDSRPNMRTHFNTHWRRQRYQWRTASVLTIKTTVEGRESARGGNFSVVFFASKRATMQTHAGGSPVIRKWFSCFCFRFFFFFSISSPFSCCIPLFLVSFFHFSSFILLVEIFLGCPILNVLSCHNLFIWM